MADKIASYSIRFDSNARQTGDEGAASLEQLKTQAARAKDNIATLSSAMRGLKGSSDEVKSAREALKAQLEAEKGVITASTVALLKQGTSLDQLTAKQKAAAKSVAAAGGPVAVLRERWKTLSEALSTSEGRTALAARGLAAVASAAATTVAAVVALGAAFGAGVLALGAWIVQSANAQRDAALLREAWTGSATNAAHLGNQIDALARKLPVPKAELNELAGSLVRALSGTTVSGQGIVNTFQAVATAASAMGQQAGAAIEGIITRSARFGRVTINPFELQGTGLKFQDVAAQLAKNLTVGIKDAQNALLTGRVKVDDAAKALKDALEARFGALNAKKLISLDATLLKFKNNLAGLASSVNIDGLLRSLSKTADLFSASTVTGKALKTIVTVIGNALGRGFEGSLPKVKELFLRSELVALNAAIAVLRVKAELDKIFGAGWDTRLIASLFDNAINTARGFARYLDVVSSQVQAVGQTARDFSSAWTAAVGTVTAAWEGFKELGSKVIDGILEGLTSGAQRVKDTVVGMADSVKNAFAAALGIHSPSLVFEGYGKNTAAGYERGLERGTPQAQAAAQDLAPPAPVARGDGPRAPATGRAGRGGGGRPMQVHVQVLVQGGGDPAKALTAPSFVQDFTRAVEEALTMAGLPMQTEPSP